MIIIITLLLLFQTPIKSFTPTKIQQKAFTKCKMSSDLAIVGCGVLGTSICKQLLSSSSQSTKITAITKTKNNHESILNCIDPTSRANLEVTTYEDICGTTKFNNVIFCAPPSGFENYPNAIQNAMNEIWNKQGAFIFTSSSAVYPYKNKEVVTESTPAAPLESSSADRLVRLLKSEGNVLEERNGYVLRLAGLYNRNRGAHHYYLTSKKDIIPGRGDYLVNLVHYDDAASACISALNYHSKKHEVASSKAKNIFIISDGNPRTRTEQCEVCVRSNAEEYRDCKVPRFEGGDQEDYGKVLDSSYASNVLGWVPRYHSFDAYFESIIE